MTGSKSCLVNKLSHYIELGDADEEKLAALEKTERSYKPLTDVYRSGDESNHLFVVKEGWLFTSTLLADGRRQVVRVYHPGDIIGFHDIAYDLTSLDLQTCTNTVLCPFPKNGLDVIFRESPRLTALLFTIAVREQVVLIDFLRATGRMNANDRLAFFLLDLFTKLRITNASMTNTFRLPLTQTDIGDLLGLTNVSVSKTFSAMEREGLLRRKAGQVTLLDAEALRETCDFVDRYHGMDISWFPGISLDATSVT